MSNTDMKILIIDDNPEIYNDFKKILIIDRNESTLNTELDLITEKLFSETVDDISLANKELTNLNALSLHMFPHFIIDYANQGQKGMEKIKQAKESGSPYVLAFVDIRMPPGWDGIETIKHIWEVDEDIQVVICTAFSDYSWEETVKNLGTKDNLLIVKKPFDTTSVRQMACALTKKWELLKNNQNHNILLENTINEKTQSLKKSLSITRATLDSSAEAIIVISSANSIKDYNNNFLELWDITKDDINNYTNKSLIAHVKNKIVPEDREKLESVFLSDISKNIKNFEINLLDGRVLDCYVRPYTLYNDIVGKVLNFRDLTDRVMLERNLEYSANHDSLTGLPNRKLLMKRLEEAVKDSQAKKAIFYVLFFDLDSFKLINDSLSHEAGDLLLKEISNRLKLKIHQPDTIARFGGDEFIVIIRNNNTNNIDRTINELISVINEPVNIFSNQLNITASIGISKYPDDGTSEHELLSCADLAMYAAKNEGRNKYKYYIKKFNSQCVTRFENEVALYKALKNNEFVLFYQPQIETNTGKIHAVEALIRWQSPEKGLIYPDEFIKDSDENGLITPIGEWVLREACKQNKVWQDMGFPKFIISVNVASTQVHNDNFINTVVSALHDFKLEPQYLEIELTENILLGNPKIIQTVNELVDLGVSVSFDDFGTGNTGLNNLIKIPVKKLKIDKSFVQNISLNKTDEVIIKAIISIAQELNLDVIAEGIETAEQADFLLKNNCPNMQGFYFSKAIAPKEMLEYLTNTYKQKKTG